MIKKTSETRPLAGTVVNTYSESQTSAYSCDYVNNMNTYSTTEQRVGTYNGKPLYRKIVEFGALPNATSKNVAHSISNLLNVVNIKGWTKRADGTTFPLPYESGSQINESIALFSNNTNISIYCGVNRTEFTTTYITLEYTKTTD